MEANGTDYQGCSERIQRSLKRTFEECRVLLTVAAAERWRCIEAVSGSKRQASYTPATWTKQRTEAAIHICGSWSGLSRSTLRGEAVFLERGSSARRLWMASYSSSGVGDFITYRASSDTYRWRVAGMLIQKSIPTYYVGHLRSKFQAVVDSLRQDSTCPESRWTSNVCCNSLVLFTLYTNSVRSVQREMA
ncbi:hypothetical protein E4U19_005099 [Claviceps sp. Clav32 group G5]|nr:hypothetical protein E4U19_005099 [Claviceps sp. Clav32 group G5]